MGVMADNLRRMIEAEGDMLGDLHLLRLGPGHLGAIVSIITHLTIQVEQATQHMDLS